MCGYDVRGFRTCGLGIPAPREGYDHREVRQLEAASAMRWRTIIKISKIRTFECTLNGAAPNRCILRSIASP